jgi:iron complex outermembrane receptor protein
VIIRSKPLALLATSVVSFSVPAADDGVHDPATIVVTATRFAAADPRVPANISVVSREDIRSTPALDLPDILKTRAGVNVSTLYGCMGMDATVDVRGFGDTAASNTLILLDGQRINPIDMGSISWSTIPLDSIQRVEIIRGSGTVLYGDRASGGVINIVTDKSGASHASLAAGAGSYGYRNADAYGAAGNDDGYFNIVAHSAASDGWRRNSQQDQQAIAGRAGFYVGTGEASLDYAAYKDSSGLPGYLLTAAYQADPRGSAMPYDRQRRDGYRLRPGVRLYVGDALALEAEIGSEHENQHADYVSFGSVSDRSKDNLSFTPRLRWTHGLGGLASETVVGADYYSGKVRAYYATAPDQSAEQTSTALYVQNLTSLTDAWTLTLGGRNQRMDQSAHQLAYAPWFSPAMDGSATRSRNAYDAGISYRAANWRAYGKVGSTFRFANMDELFGYNPFTGVPVFAGDLRPQHGTIKEVGGSLTVGALQGRASLYRMDLTDEIGYDGAAFANVNFAPTRRQGLETEIDWRIVEGLKARLAYAYTDARFRSGTYGGNRLPSVPRDKATAQLIWDAGTVGSYTISANYVGSQPYSGDFANAQGRLDGHTTVDLQAAWKLKPWTITAKLLNAFDKRYAAVAGYASYLPTPDHYYYPADGRSLFVSGRYEFR